MRTNDSATRTSDVGSSKRRQALVEDLESVVEASQRIFENISLQNSFPAVIKRLHHTRNEESGGLRVTYTRLEFQFPVCDLPWQTNDPENTAAEETVDPDGTLGMPNAYLRKEANSPIMSGQVDIEMEVQETGDEPAGVDERKANDTDTNRLTTDNVSAEESGLNVPARHGRPRARRAKKTDIFLRRGRVCGPKDASNSTWRTTYGPRRAPSRPTTPPSETPLGFMPSSSRRFRGPSRGATICGRFNRKTARDSTGAKAMARLRKQAGNWANQFINPSTSDRH